MHSQKKKRKKSKRPSKQSKYKSIEYNHYQPDNPLTIYYAKYINKDKKV